MTRVFSVTPIHVDAAELERRRARYARLSPPGLRVDLVDAGPGAPPQLASAADLRASETSVAAALSAADPGGYDAVMPDCVLDPAVPGMLALVLEHLAGEGHTVAAVARNPVIAGELRRRAASYGFPAPEVAVLDLDVADIADPVRWNAALRTALHDLAAHGATAVINGCSAVNVEPHQNGPLLIDPAALALRLLAER